MDVIQDSPSGENDQPVSEASGTEKKEDVRDSERRVVSRRPAKRTRSGSKKPKRTTRSRTAPAEEESKETEAALQEDTGQSAEKTADVSEKRVISRRPAKRPRKSTKSTKRTTRAKADDKQQSQTEKEADNAAAPPEAEATETVSPEPAKAGEPVAEAMPETTKPAPPPPEPAADAPSDAPAERTPEPQSRGAQEHRRTRRRRQPRRQNEGGGSAENRDRADRIPQSVVEILADTWTEEKARKYLSEGFLATLSTPLVSRSKVEKIDEEALRDRLKVVRRVLADECMVEDDASDLILLDMVMNALADRLEVYQLTSGNASPEQLDQILQLRYNADRRLIETVTALKNA